MIREKKFFQVVSIMLLAMFLLTGCGGPKPDAVVTSFLTALQTNDYQTAFGYLSGNELTEEDFTFDDEAQEKLIKGLFGSITFEQPVTTSSEKDKATVDAKVTTLDSVKIFNDIMSDAMGMAFTMALSETSEEDMSAMMNAMFVNAFNSPDAPKTSTTITFNLEKIDGDWKIIGDEKIFNALTGNLGATFN